MSRRPALLIIGLAALAVVCVVALGKQMIGSGPQHGPPAIGPPASAPIARTQETPARPQSNSSPARDGTAGMGAPPTESVASGDPFDPGRSPGGAAPGPTGPRPLLYGVVAGGGVKSRAYIEDPMTRMVRGYQIGDMVGGWRLDQIREDRVVISGAELRIMEVLSRDSTDSRPVLLSSAEVTAEAQNIVRAEMEGRRLEPGPAPAAQVSASTDSGESVPRVAGPIPAQLFRPARVLKQE